LWTAFAVYLSATPAAAQPEVTRTTVIDDHDWRPPDAVAQSAGIEHEMTSELLLKTELKEPVFLFDPTEDETITCMTDFKGRLYIGSCTRPTATDTGSVFTYDPERHEWQKVFQVNEQGLVRMKVYGDRLYIPGLDANDGGWELGNIYIHDGESWVERRTVPRAVHIPGLAVYEGRIYVSAGAWEEPPPGIPLDEAIRKRLVSGYCGVLSSGDEGRTWHVEYRPDPKSRSIVGYMTTFQNKLVVNAHDDLLFFDGNEWTRLGLRLDALDVLDYAVEGDTLVMGTPLGLCLFDGSRFWRSQWFILGNIRALQRFGCWWILVFSNLTGAATVGSGPGATDYPPLRDKSAQPFYAGLYVVTPQELLFAWEGAGEDQYAWRPRTLRTKEMLVSAHCFHGRLYLGTHPEGRVLVLPVQAEGALDSAPRFAEYAGKYRLRWTAATPPGTWVGLQVRTASTAEALREAAFAGADMSDMNYFDKTGQAFDVTEPGFIQYRVTLGTSDPALTPYLKRVIVTRER